jgi:carbon monoxide dehydrogenase subunit G
VESARLEWLWKAFRADSCEGCGGRAPLVGLGCHDSGMTTDSVHVGERIDRPADEVYEYVADPGHLAEWAPGLGSAVEQVGGEWFVETGMGRVRVAFAPRNSFGVLDHEVTVVSTGETFGNPMRVVPYGHGCEVVFTVRRGAGVSDEEFARDTLLVTDDLARIKRIVEARR